MSHMISAVRGRDDLPPPSAQSKFRGATSLPSPCYSRRVVANFAVRQMTRPAPTHALTYPKTFRARQIAANGTKLYVRVSGTGRAVVLLHGYGETGDMWVPLAKDLARDHIVVAPDLRGMGSPRSRPTATTKKRKPATLPASSMRSTSSERRSSPTTSATWSATPLPRSTATA